MEAELGTLEIRSSDEPRIIPIGGTLITLYRCGPEVTKLHVDQRRSVIIMTESNNYREPVVLIKSLWTILEQTSVRGWGEAVQSIEKLLAGIWAVSSERVGGAREASWNRSKHKTSNERAAIHSDEDGIKRMKA